MERAVILATEGTIQASQPLDQLRRIRVACARGHGISPAAPGADRERR